MKEFFRVVFYFVCPVLLVIFLGLGICYSVFTRTLFGILIIEDKELVNLLSLVLASIIQSIFILFTVNLTINYYRMSDKYHYQPLINVLLINHSTSSNVLYDEIYKQNTYKNIGNMIEINKFEEIYLFDPDESDQFLLTILLENISQNAFMLDSVVVNKKEIINKNTKIKNRNLILNKTIMLNCRVDIKQQKVNVSVIGRDLYQNKIKNNYFFSIEV
jgi:hypothetical protein